MIVIVKLMGGLGNQMFQYAAGRALAERRGARLLLDLSSYEHDRLGRRYRLDHFNIRAEIASPDDVERVTGLGRRGLLSRARRRAERLLPRHWRSVFTERQRSYDRELFYIRRSVMLSGYWQSPQYFASIEHLLREELRWREPPDAYNEALTQEIIAAEGVSVHVRRGDYVENKSHNVLPIGYYQAAVARIAEVAYQASYYVFSDDMPWCKGHLDLPGRTTYVDHNGPEADYEDLRLMSLCHHHIIANSSFSWWGAWLCERPGQLVIAPRQWFVLHDLDPKNRFPASWQVL